MASNIIKYVYITYVSPPRPIEVKKLMENLVFRGLSRGIRPSNAGAKNLYICAHCSCYKEFCTFLTYIMV